MRKVLNIIRSTNFGAFTLRMLMLFVVYAVCRAAFAAYNYDYFAPIKTSDLWSIIKGGFIFDSGSIFYSNLLFIVLSLLPLRLRERSWYQNMLVWVFVAFNGLGLLVNIADIYYYPFKLSRITSDDFHFFSEGNFGTLFVSFLKDYWGGAVLWIVLIAGLWFGAKHTIPAPSGKRTTLKFAVTQILILALTVSFCVFGIRGYNASKASFPVTMSDASLYVKPKYAPLILSNPFCIIRTAKQKTPSPRYFPDDQLDSLYRTTHHPMDSVAVNLPRGTNIVLIVLESFGSAHIKSFSDRFPADTPSYTPFLDSLSGASYCFRNAYQNGLRSIDAMPAMWASIPSFKSQFLSLPNSVAEYKALPHCLKEMGYETRFLHGSVRTSMSFVSFGKMAGVDTFYSREDYEAAHGTGDFDGKWGIWDHKFLPFAAQQLNKASSPFFATLFTLSSHHPFALPAKFDNDNYNVGTLPIHRTVKYSDEALRHFFNKASESDWFNNTLFVITADHGSGADNKKYLRMPYAYAVPLIFYYPAGGLKGSSVKTTQHIDLMPTLLRMVGYNESFFSFGRDAFNDPDSGFAINYYGGAFNYITDSAHYVFNEREISGIYNYREDTPDDTDPVGREAGASDEAQISRMKAFIQQYYKRLKNRDFK